MKIITNKQDHAEPLYEIHGLIGTVTDPERRRSLHLWFTLVMDELESRRSKDAGVEPLPSSVHIWS